MTNPLDPDSVFQLLSMELAGIEETNGATFDLSFVSFPGFSYIVETDESIHFLNPDSNPVLLATNHIQAITSLVFSPGWRFVRVRRN